MTATDIDIPEILDRIRRNVSRNQALLTEGQIAVHSLDLKTDRLGDCIATKLHNSVKNEDESGRKSAGSDKKLADIDMKSADSDRKLADSDRKSADSDRKSANSDRKSAGSDRQSADAKMFDLIVAGDLVYDNDITDALLCFIQDALRTQPNLQESFPF